MFLNIILRFILVGINLISWKILQDLMFIYIRFSSTLSELTASNLHLLVCLDLLHFRCINVDSNISRYPPIWIVKQQLVVIHFKNSTWAWFLDKNQLFISSSNSLCSDNLFLPSKVTIVNEFHIAWLGAMPLSIICIYITKSCCKSPSMHNASTTNL